MPPKLDNAGMERELRGLIAKKEMYYSKIQRVFDYTAALDDEAILKRFKAEYNTVHKSLEELKIVVDNINDVNLKLNEDFIPNFQTIDTADQLIGHIEESYKSVVLTKMESVQFSPKAVARLPKIDIIKFNGDKKQWPLFYESFCSLVHHNRELDDSSKAHYLLAALEGKALDICVGILPTAANYKLILDTLKERFEDKRLLANTYLSQILDFKPAQNENVNCLHAFLEKFDTAVNALKNLKLDDLADYILTYIALSKLDPQSHKYFEMKRDSASMPSYMEVVQFVKSQSKTLSHTAKTNTSSHTKSSLVTTYKQQGVTSNAKAKFSQSFVANTNAKASGLIDCCSICKKDIHSLFKCDQFVKLEPFERYQMAKERSLCLNCLNPRHKVSNCTSSNACRICSGKHHTMLHFIKDISTKAAVPDQSLTTATNEFKVEKVEHDNNTLSLCSTEFKFDKSLTTLLCTAIINAESITGKTIPIRVLLDTASQSNFITVNCCKKLQLSIFPKQLTVVGIGETTRPVRGEVLRLFASSRFDSSIKFEFSALVVDKITDKLPSMPIDVNALQYLRGLRLADDTFHMPSEIDGIIGAELVPELLGTAKVVGPQGMPVAVQSKLGFVIMGKAPVARQDQCAQSFCSILQPTLDSMLERFFEIEDVPANSLTNQADIKVENFYKSTVQRDSSGRYIVALPFENFPPPLGDSFDVALNRFNSLEKKFQASPEFRGRYGDVIGDYLKQGHMSPVLDNKKTGSSYYLPHFAVLKDSVSTPLRVVFDASTKTSNGKSLNDVLEAGPKLQTDLVKILLNFRVFAIGIMSDVRQMYRNIWICPEHRQYQRVLWRSSPEEPIQTFELNTVTFGVKPAPYLSLRTVQQLCKDEASKFPLASKVVETDIYIDDVTSSISDINEAENLYNDLLGLFKAGGFSLVKWSTNSKELWEKIPTDIRIAQTVEFDDVSKITSLKVLGLQWDPITDEFSFKFLVPDKKCTKRNILSSVSRIWDPLGFLSPVTVFAKLLIKELWNAKIGWDEVPPEEIKKLWLKFHNELPLLQDLRISRFIGFDKAAKISLFGFADACKSSYGAVVYALVVTKENRRFVNLLCSKSKVAPLKVVSIARLELCAALLLAKLLKYIMDCLITRIDFDAIFAFTDSSVTLHWINSSPNRWSTFVAHRVSQIQALLPTVVWYHVDGKCNPADGLSRGLTPAELVRFSPWITGPQWLYSERNEWPVHTINDFSVPECCEEQKKTTHTLVTVNEPNDWLYDYISRCSSWKKLLRVTVYVLRFVKLLPRQEIITSLDLEKAEQALIRCVQNIHFDKEIQSNRSGKQCSAHLRQLNPFLDKNNCIRVGGRLKHANLEFDQQHPYLLPNKEHFVDLLIDYTHCNNLHTGPHLLLSILRQKYWILSARNLVRKRIKMCNFCFKFRPKALTPIMSDLPAYRVSEVKPFVETGVDYAGPFYITISKHRGVKSQKAYLCLFICLATKAVHLELASDLTTTTFLNCLKRFLSRRGPCKVIHSDCGTNFIGAKSELDDVYTILKSKEYVETLNNEFAAQNIIWKFNPPHAPHFGGIWEANIKSVKSHLYKVIGQQILTYEELTTVLVQIEALLNSRPLCWLSSDPTEPQTLTPAHFLNLTPLQSLPSEEVTDRKINILTRKQMLDHMVQSYWNRWRLEYLHSLQTRQKWNTPDCPVYEGMLVLIKENNAPPFQWPLGVIDTLLPGKDGVARVAIIKTKTGRYKRPVVRLCPLPTQ